MRPQLPLLLLVLAAGCGDGSASATLLNVSYDPTRELFEEINPTFSAAWAREHDGQTVNVRMSHGGSGRQARAIIDGLDADVVTLGIPFDVDAIARESGAVNANWREQLPGSPWTSTIVFVVRRGNPRGIRNWPDLVRGETQVITASPKTSGAARLAYLGAYAHAKRHGFDSRTGDEAGTAMVRELYRRVPVLDSGARGASNSFGRNHLGDVLLTWENEAHLLLAELPNEGLEIVVPPESILAEPPAAVLDRNVDRRGTRALAEAYLRHLFTPEVQEIAARHHYRPHDAAVLARHRETLPPLDLFRPEDVFGDWDTIQATHFADGALFDRILRENGPR